ncbi:MaoC family dehydratase [Hydrogenophaga sp. SNF1]|uniref:MaoC family dehydratase n=1 Tax=Hydrogenophaga sp. SNF1 TaxID=3098762 RepID=UPI002ACBF732|nr:MaoC family dehydratase [Hydrogenophaga sp. SNF1]WQB84717.1 MaoC family dehydratase [Hydrogenophaga sp. SNF1]
MKHQASTSAKRTPGNAPLSGLPHAALDMPTLAQAALLYRLSGDQNPLHADPGTARRAGFERPILHGRCTFGIAAWGLVRLFCPDAPERLTAMRARFSRPVFPGETLRLEVWLDGAQLHFQALVPQRSVLVLSNGVARLAPA